MKAVKRIHWVLFHRFSRSSILVVQHLLHNPLLHSDYFWLYDSECIHYDEGTFGAGNVIFSTDSCRCTDFPTGKVEVLC
jgi:hypothetical protein